MTKVYVVMSKQGSVRVSHSGDVQKDGDLGRIVEQALQQFKSEYPTESVFDGDFKITTSPPA